MFLFHGTWEDNKDKILDNKKISNIYRSDITELIDNIFVRFYEKNPRENCIYLSKDSINADAYDYAFKIDTNKLNKNLLYVGDYNKVDNLYSILMSEHADEAFLKKISKEYIDSIIEFKEYEKNIEKYKDTIFPEFMYFGEIKVSEKDLD